MSDLVTVRNLFPKETINKNKAEAQVILEKAFREIRALGLAPIFKWGRKENGHSNILASNITDFDGFHELPGGMA